MSRIRIKHFGPIKEGNQDNDGWLDVKKVTVFIGNQGSGKSSVAKLISIFSWIEKVLTRGDYTEKEFTAKRFKDVYCDYQGVQNYFIAGKTEIDYQGDSYSMSYSGAGEFSIKKIGNKTVKYALPQIMYVPAERNFISMVNRPELIKELPSALVTFLSEYGNAKQAIKGTLKLPINDAALEYNKQYDYLYVKGDDYRIKLTEASSGFQSLVPLYLVSWYLSASVQDDDVNEMSSDDRKRFMEEIEVIWNSQLTEDQKAAAFSALSSKFNKSAFYNIVEEPEQNLYPISQKKVLCSLLEFNNLLSPNKLIITTHSPYIINYLTLSVKADSIKRRISGDEARLSELNTIFPIKSTVHSEDLSIYEIDDKGLIKILCNYDGLPSDENYLNDQLAESNDIFTQLLTLEDTWA